MATCKEKKTYTLCFIKENVPMTFFQNKAINKNVFQSVTLETLNDPWLRDLLKMEKAMKTLI